MRILGFSLLLLLVGLPALAQTAPALSSANSAWTRMQQQLKTGDTVRVQTARGKMTCKLEGITADSLVCKKKVSVTYHRDDVRSVTVSHRGRSTLLGAAIGGGAGAAVGGGLGTSGGIIGKGGLAAIFGVPLALIGAGIGAATDFSHTNVYRAP